MYEIFARTKTLANRYNELEVTVRRRSTVERLKFQCNFSFLKNSQVQINFKLQEKNRMITY